MVLVLVGVGKLVALVVEMVVRVRNLVVVPLQVVVEVVVEVHVEVHVKMVGMVGMAGIAGMAGVWVTMTMEFRSYGKSWRKSCTCGLSQFIKTTAICSAPKVPPSSTTRCICLTSLFMLSTKLILQSVGRGAAGPESNNVLAQFL